MEVEINAQSSNFLSSGERFVPGVTISSLTNAYHISRYRFAQQFAVQKSTLDCGCGVGYGSAILAEQAEFVVGGDLSYPSVRYGSEHNSNQKALDYVQFDCRGLPFASGSYDTVVCFELIEHISEHDVLLQEIKRVLKNDGAAIISTPERETYNAFISAPNPFHTKELSFEEFHDLLGKYFTHVTIYWQTLKSPYLELYNQSVQINELRSQLESLKRIIRRPWLILSRLPLIGKLLSNTNYWHQHSRITTATLQSYIENKNVYPHPAHLTFELQREREAVYMVAVCQNRQTE